MKPEITHIYLDLDETCFHTTSPAFEDLPSVDDVVARYSDDYELIVTNYDNDSVSYVTMSRPGIRNFISALRQKYPNARIFALTSAALEYAEKVVRTFNLDIEQIVARDGSTDGFKSEYYREGVCVLIDNLSYYDNRIKTELFPGNLVYVQSRPEFYAVVGRPEAYACTSEWIEDTINEIDEKTKRLLVVKSEIFDTHDKT